MRRHPHPWRFRAVNEGKMLELEGRGTVDEIVIERWFHLEQMDKRVWWIRIGDVRVVVRLKNGTHVEVKRGVY